MQVNKKNIFLITFLVTFIIYFIVIVFFDFKIAMSIGNKFVETTFVKYFDKFVKTLVLIPIYFIVVIYLSKKFFFWINGFYLKVIILVILFVLFSLASLLFLFNLNQEIDQTWYKLRLASVIIINESSFILITSILLKYIYLNKEENINYMFNCTIKFALFLILSWLTILCVKYIFGRNRPEDVLNNSQSFQYAFEINFNRTKNSTSFPSGHTLSMMQLIVFSYLLDYKKTKKIKNLKYIFILLIILLSIVVGASRILMQKHFLTDVSFTIFLAILYYWATPFMVKKITGE